MDALIELVGVEKVYRMGPVEVRAIDHLDLSIKPGEMVAIMGPSGSGKSTLMNILGCLDRPSSGIYRLNGQETGKLNDDELAEIRNREIGFIFQSYNLLPQLTALENVEVPLLYRGQPAHERRELARKALESVGLADRMDHRPVQMSGGQQQRVAVARALAGEPATLLADEPTGNLDSHTELQVIAICQDLNAQGQTVVIVTHSEEVASYCRRVVRLRDGVIERDEINDNPDRAGLKLAALLEAVGVDAG